MAQHCLLAFCILISIMRKHYEVVFIDDSFDLTDDQFWETLYIGALDESWKIANQHVLR